MSSEFFLSGDGPINFVFDFKQGYGELETQSLTRGQRIGKPKATIVANPRRTSAEAKTISGRQLSNRSMV